MKLFPIAILAGGLATRLRPVTEKIPKALIEVQGGPFIAHQLRLLKSQGIQEVVLCLAYKGEQVVDYLEKQPSFGLHIRYSFDWPHLLGTAGAIKKAIVLLGNAFFVMYGDSYLPCDFKKVQSSFVQSGKRALMTVFYNQGKFDKSNIEWQNGEILNYDKIKQTEKMHYIDYGLGVFKKAAFDHVSDDQPTDLVAVYQDCLHRNQLAGYEVIERFYEIGSFPGIHDLEQYLLTRQKEGSL